MSSLFNRIRQEGISLGGPQRLLPAYLDFWRLNHAVPEGKVLVILYCNYNDKIGWSASPGDDFSTFHLIRRSPVVQIVEFYAVDKALAGM